MPTRSKITGTGSYAPPRLVTNNDLSKTIDTSDEWIFTRTGIKSRHLIDHEGAMSTVDMSEQAALKALEAAQTTPDQLDMIVLASMTADYKVPSGACVLQERLKAYNACAFDVGAACAGSLFALNIANNFIQTGSHKKILVVGAECMSSILNWSDRNTCVLFGDAAGAAILEPSESESGFLGIDLYSDGRQWPHIHIPHGGSKSPLTAERLAQAGDRVVMNGRETYKYAVRALVDAAHASFDKHRLRPSDIRHVVAHQANLRIIEQVADRIEIPLSRFVLNIERYGNTSSASLMTSFDEGKRQGRFCSGDAILLLAIGGGFAWGSGIYRA